jgi:hypothetical protein
MAIVNNSNLPTVQRFKYEDYKDAPGWFSQFLMTLNLFVNSVYNIINGGITYGNLGVIQPFTFMYTPGTTSNFNFSSPTIGVPSNVIIGNVYVGNNLTIHPAAATQLYWHYSQGKIFVDSIVGLTSGVTYTISVQVS